MTSVKRGPVGRDLGLIVVGDRPVDRVRADLAAMDVGLNESAERLLSSPEMELPNPLAVRLVSCSVNDLGLADGGVLTEIFAAAQQHGLVPCPLATGAYLRLVHREAESQDTALRRQRPPEAALHVASPVSDPDFEVPKGFYLRTVEGRRWLRGYHCSDDYVSPPDTTYVFARSD